MADLTDAQKIARLERLRQLGIQSTSADGVSTSFNQRVINKSLRQLRAQQPDQRDRRPIVSQIKLT